MLASMPILCNWKMMAPAASIAAAALSVVTEPRSPNVPMHTVPVGEKEVKGMLQCGEMRCYVGRMGTQDVC